MCCYCRLQPGTGGRINQSTWTSKAKEAAVTGSCVHERGKGRKMAGRGEGKRGRSGSGEERRRTADTATGEEPGHERRREPKGKCPRGLH
ncbi:hypothetical protein NDU88_006740 [Pleurodeles waltl]|uniref:Uncharacterized protein n=1 Tax=Pleurodeles waltl TaxID=8319 RepID=A0AAV7QLZ5_PLEWA|nr:hypothetical protein NDU88_006740 [Pleurodeles waltl]